MFAALGTAVLAFDTEDVFPEALKESLLERARTIKARRGQILIAEGALSTDVYYIVSGRVQISLLSPQGRETILREMGPGRLFGELAALDDRPRSASVVALEDSVMANLSGAGFRTLLADVPGAGFWMAQQLAARVRNLTEKTFELATMPVSNRLQSELLRLCNQADIIDDACTIAPMPTHADLASRIGTHREAVTRELGLLANEGLVAQSGRTLTVASVSGLIAMRDRTAR
jgi:CRP/FNR family transcriptional regulator, cyclic AMP receptor protein